MKGLCEGPERWLIPRLSLKAIRGKGYEGVLIAPGVASKTALTVLAESVESVPVLTDSSELDSVCKRGGGASGASRCFAASGEVSAVAVAAARICCF